MEIREKYSFLKKELNSPKFENEDEEIDWFTIQLYGLWKQATRIRKENKQMKHNITMAIDMLEEFKDKYGVYGSYIDEILEELRKNNEK